MTDELGTSVSAHDQAAASEPKKPVAEPEDKGVAADTASGTTAPAASEQATVAAPRHAAGDGADGGGRVDTKSAAATAPSTPSAARGSGLHNR